MTKPVTAASDDQAARIHALRADGATIIAIAQKMRIGVVTIRLVLGMNAAPARKNWSRRTVRALPAGHNRARRGGQ